MKNTEFNTMAQELREKMCLTLIPENTPIYEKMFD